MSACLTTLGSIDRPVQVARGFLLHGRPYRETSLIAAFLTDTEGRVDVVIRSARSRTRTSGIFSPVPFCLYELEWGGRSDLKAVRSCEPVGQAMPLKAHALYCGFYLNELLYYLLPYHHADTAVFGHYFGALNDLSAGMAVEPVLRCFELELLDMIGYGVCLDKDIHGQAVDPGCRYVYTPESGLVPAGSNDHAGSQVTGRGAEFLQIGARDFSGEPARKLAKRLLRALLDLYLGGRPLRSRELFQRTVTPG